MQHATDGGRWCQATASSSNALHLPISRIAGRYPFNGEMAYSPTQSPLTTLEFYHRIAGGILHHAQRMIRQEILLETLLLVCIKPGKIRLVIGKIPVISSIYGPLLSVRLLSHARPNSLCPQLHCFFTAQYGGWQRAANRHLHRDTTRQQNRTVIFQPYMRLERAHFIARNVHSGGVVHFVVSAGGDGESGDGPFAVIKHRSHIRWENALMPFTPFTAGLAHHKK